MSLKSKLYNTIKEKGYLTLEEVYQVCRELSKKQSNGERRMRELYDRGVTPIIHEKGYIIAYKYDEKEDRSKESHLSANKESFLEPNLSETLPLKTELVGKQEQYCLL